MGKIKICPTCGEENPEFSKLCGNCSEDLKLVKAVTYNLKAKPMFSVKKLECELSGFPKLIFHFLILFSFIEAWVGMCIFASTFLSRGLIVPLIGVLVLCKGLAVAFGYGHAYLSYKRNQINKENIERIFMEMNKKE